MTFLEVLASLAAVVVLIASVLVVTTLSPRRWERSAAAAGLALAFAGVALYFAFFLISLGSYDEQPDPAWLTAVGIVALIVAGAGLLAVVSAIVGVTIRAARGSPERRV